MQPTPAVNPSRDWRSGVGAPDNEANRHRCQRLPSEIGSPLQRKIYRPGLPACSPAALI